MNSYLRAVEDLELKITIALAEYSNTKDVSYLVKASYYTHQLEAEMRHHDSI